MSEQPEEKRDIDAEHAKAHQFALVRFTDMNEEMLTEIQELVVGLLEKMSINPAAKETHETLCKKFGSGWNVVIGKNYGIEGQAVEGTTLQMFYQGVYAVDIWKAER